MRDPFMASDCANTPSITIGTLISILTAFSGAGFAGKGPLAGLSNEKNITRLLDAIIRKAGMEVTPETQRAAAFELLKRAPRYTEASTEQLIGRLRGVTDWESQKAIDEAETEIATRTPGQPPTSKVVVSPDDSNLQKMLRDIADEAKKDQEPKSVPETPSTTAPPQTPYDTLSTWDRDQVAKVNQEFNSYALPGDTEGKQNIIKAAYNDFIDRWGRKPEDLTGRAVDSDTKDSFKSLVEDEFRKYNPEEYEKWKDGLKKAEEGARRYGARR